MKKIKCALIGSGNIGTDLLYKLQRSDVLEPVWMVGIDANSEGLARAKELGLKTTAEGIDGLIPHIEADEIKIAFDATSAYVHADNSAKVNAKGVLMIDLTPAAIGPFCVPPVNLSKLDSNVQNVNMVTCGGQATIPMVAAVSRVAPVPYAEIIASVSSRSAGPGTRANIDEFTQTTSRGVEVVGGAKKGKAIIILNPAEPPMIMRNTVFALSEPVDEQKVIDSVNDMVAGVQSYVPGYHLKQEVQFEHYSKSSPLHIPGYGDFEGTKSSIFLEVEGAAHYLPSYAGNLDIMTSAALGTAERLAQLKYAVAA